MLTNKMPKNAERFHCEICDFKCFQQNNFDVHLLTRKHKMLTNTDKKMPENAELFVTNVVKYINIDKAICTQKEMFSKKYYCY